MYLSKLIKNFTISSEDLKTSRSSIEESKRLEYFNIPFKTLKTF